MSKAWSDLVIALFLLVAMKWVVFGEMTHFATEDYDYLVFYGGDENSIYGATDECGSHGGKLADVPDYSIFEMFNHTLPSVVPPGIPAFFIDTWQGDDYYPHCIAFYIGAMVNQPDNGCDGPMPFICQVPKEELEHLE